MSFQKALSRTLLFLACLATSLAWAGEPQTAYTVTTSDLKAMAAKLEASPALAEGQCNALPAIGDKSLTYSCAKPGANTDATFRSVVGETGGSLNTVTGSCPTNCVMMFCPYPNIRCCSIYTQTPCQ